MPALDGLTDRILIASPLLHSMERGKMEYVTSTLIYMHTKKLQTTLCTDTHTQIQNQSFRK